MVMEMVASALLGLLVVWMVFGPLITARAAASAAPAELYDPDDEEPTRKVLALAALKEIEFDRATGKLSDADYQMLVTKYTAEAVAAMREEEVAAAPAQGVDVEAMVAARVRALRAEPAGRVVAVCATCGPRPEADAAFCSECGAKVRVEAACPTCAAPLSPDGRFCEMCGSKVAA